MVVRLPSIVKTTSSIQFWNDGNRLSLLDSSDHSPRSSEAKLFGIEFSDLHVSKEDSVKPWCHRLESQLFEAEYLADEGKLPEFIYPKGILLRRVNNSGDISWHKTRIVAVGRSWDGRDSLEPGCLTLRADAHC